VGLTDYKPEFQVLANQQDITDTLRDRLLSLSLTDATGFESDTLELVLADDKPGRPLRKPSRGAELQLSIGYNGSLVRMGVFVVDEVSLAGWPGTMTIRARGAPFEKSTGGASHLQTQKSRAWKRDTTIKAMVTKIAREHGLEPLVSKSLENIELPHFDQTAESDVSFLTRVGNRYDAMVKPAGGKLAFLKRGEQLRSDGSAMPRITAAAKDVSSWTFQETSRDDGGTVVAFWHHKKQAKRKQVQIGSGEPVKQLRQFYTSEEAAKAAAQAELDKRNRARGSLSISLPGNPTLSAECTLEVSGLHPDMPAEWLVTRVTHRLGSDGYKCDVDAELPNDD
jgi:phage protein D